MDDHQDTREMFSCYLAAFGHDVREAVDGHEGLQVLETYRPDVVITDIAMPIVNGYEFIRRARLPPFSYHGPIYVITAYSISKEQHLDLKFDGVLTKPVSPGEVAKLVNSAEQARQIA